MEYGDGSSITNIYRWSWLSYPNECDWYSIDCRSTTADNSNLQVRSTQLEYNNVQNTIPTEIRYLSTLQSISFWNNQLSGAITASITGTTQGLPYIQSIIFRTIVWLERYRRCEYLRRQCPLISKASNWIQISCLVLYPIGSCHYIRIYSAGPFRHPSGATITALLRYFYSHNNQLSGKCWVCLCPQPVFLNGVTYISHVLSIISCCNYRITTIESTIFSFSIFTK